MDNVCIFKKETHYLIGAELTRIPEGYRRPFNSAHEGFAVLYEEVLELQNVVFWGEKSFGSEEYKKRLRAEAVQVAAMAVRMIQEL